MKKQETSQQTHTPFTDWDIFPWSKEMYQKYESDFQIILKEYRDLKAINGNNAILARKVWLERKGGTIINNNEIMCREKYQHFSNMFSHFSEWLSFQERKNMSEEQIRTKIDGLKFDIKKLDFSITRPIIQTEKQKQEDTIDPIIQDALDKF